TRRMLEILTGLEGLDFSITTKSVLILRDLDLLRVIAAKHRFGVHMTVTTLDARLARLLEPKAPPPSKRLRAVRALAAARIHVGVNAMPILPGLTDDSRALDARYRELYARSAYLRGEYAERMAKLIAELRARYGLDSAREESPPAARHPQLALPFSGLL